MSDAPVLSACCHMDGSTVAPASISSSAQPRWLMRSSRAGSLLSMA